MQYFISLLLVTVVASVCFIISGFTGYKVVAFALLVTVSLLAMFFEIKPVLLAALLSALIWDFFFIPPRFTFHVGSTEDMLLLLMYFVIALLNAVLTFKIRQVEKESLEKEEKANTVKLYNTLLNSLSHELRTPIATIIGSTDNLISDGAQLTDENKKELLHEISTASLRLNEQVENLLNMSRIESGFIKPKKDWCDVNELVYQVVNRLEAKLKTHDLKIHIDENLPLIKVDFGLMFQVIYNLLLNATIYTPEHSIIWITVHLKDEINKTKFAYETTKSKLVLIIQDNGNGFPTEEVEKVFEKFYRLKNSKAGGTGLGLSIVKGFTEAHNGTIQLENIKSGGAKFTIEISAETSYLNNLKNE